MLHTGPLSLRRPLPDDVVVGGDFLWTRYRRYPVFSAPWLAGRTLLFGSLILIFAVLTLLGTLGIVAAEACYDLGREFLDEEVAQLKANRDWLVEHLPQAVPGIEFDVPQATYLMFLDFRNTALAGERPAAWLLKHARVAMSEGADFGPGGEGKARLNFATSPAILEEAVTRIGNAVRLR